MGIFDIFLKNRPKPRGRYEGAFRLFSGYEPHFRTWGGELYESDLVRAAIDARATHISKLRVTLTGSARQTLANRLKHAPNQFQTWSQFLYRLSTILDIHNTAFIVPVYDTYGEISGIFTPLPNACEIVQYNGVPYLRYTFGWGETAAIELESCGVMTRHQYKSDFFGESNHALFPVMELINIQNQGIEEGVRSSASYRFMAQLSNFAKAADLAKERQRFTEENLSREAKGGGLLLFPNTYSNVKQIEVKPWIVDDKQRDLINKSVYAYFGVNEDVLENRAIGDAWAAFYEGAVEPFAIQFSEVMTKMLFTLRERSQGNFVQATANRLQYLSNQDKLNVSALMLDRGIFNRDDVREIWNLPPLPNGEGQAYIIRGEYVNATEKIADDTNE